LEFGVWGLGFGVWGLAFTTHHSPLPIHHSPFTTLTVAVTASGNNISRHACLSSK